MPINNITDKQVIADNLSNIDQHIIAENEQQFNKQEQLIKNNEKVKKNLKEYIKTVEVKEIEQSFGDIRTNK